MFSLYRQDSLDTFIKQVLDHIGGAQYADLSTGKLKVKLIRDDYDPETLPLFTEDNGIILVQDDDSSGADNVPNEIIVNWHDPVTNTDGAVKAQNLGAIQSVGVISEERDYKAIPTHNLAARVAQRDLDACNSALLRLTLQFDRRGGVLEPAGCFRLSLPNRGIDSVVLRVGSIDEKDNGSLTITVIQDVFGLPSTVYSSGDSGNGWTPPGTTPRPVLDALALELPYITLAGVMGDAAAASIPADAGFIGILAKSPGNSAINYQLVTCTGDADFTGTVTGDRTPSGTLRAAVTRLEKPFKVTLPDYDIQPGDAALIGGEIVRNDSINPDAGEIIVGRGCGDTLPAGHASGETIWFFDGVAESDNREYVSGETVDAKLLTRTATATLEAALASVESVTMAHRQARPYLPGNMKVNGEQKLTITTPEAFTLSWAHRNRVIQSNNLVAHDEAGVAPESGTEYEITLMNNGEAVRAIRTAEDSFVYPDQTDEETNLPIVESFDQIVINSERDGLESWQSYTLSVV